LPTLATHCTLVGHASTYEWLEFFIADLSHKLSYSPSALHVLAPMREGGIERVVTMMSVRQKANSVHVAAVVEPDGAEGHPFILRLEALGIPVIPIVVGARSYVREYRQLSALVARLRPDVVHTHGYRADVIGGAVARRRGVAAVSTVHGFTGGDRRNRVYERVQLSALRRADAVIAVSEPLVHRLAEAGVPRERIHCVPNGFAPAEVTVTREAARRRLGISPDATVIGWVGRLSREKGADVMLDALAQCDSSWRLAMIGEGPALDQLTQQAAKLGIVDRVVWHGSIADAGTLLAAFDAFVLSSRTEGTPIALLEAMDCRVPIVATGVGGVPDVVTSAHAILVAPEKPQAIADALAELKREPSAAVARSNLARQRLLQSFGTAAWLEAVRVAYQAACTSAADRRRK
jgi:glycosyltransferase involved in cell wall biosynthesis